MVTDYVLQDLFFWTSNHRKMIDSLRFLRKKTGKKMQVSAFYYYKTGG